MASGTCKRCGAIARVPPTATSPLASCPECGAEVQCSAHRGDHS